MNEAIFSTGKTWQQFMESITKNRDVFEGIYNNFSPSAGDVEPFRQAAPLRILAIGEQWCPDVYHTLPLVAKIADQLPDVELRIFERDSHPEIMDQFLSDGKRRIPVLAFFTPGFELICWWSGRNKEADAWVSSVRRGRPYDEMPPEERQRFQEDFERLYNDVYEQANLEEMKHLLRERLRAAG